MSELKRPDLSIPVTVVGTYISLKDGGIDWKRYAQDMELYACELEGQIAVSDAMNLWMKHIPKPVFEKINELQKK